MQDPRWGQNSGSESKLTPEPARCRGAVLTAPGKVPQAKKRVSSQRKKTPKIKKVIQVRHERGGESL